MAEQAGDGAARSTHGCVVCGHILCLMPGKGTSTLSVLTGRSQEGKEETMPGPLFLHQLDEATSRGCDTPFCTHDHGAELYLTPRCHPGVGVRVEYMDDLHGLPCGAVVGLRCWKCQTPVVYVALTMRLNVTPTCRHGRALDVMYSEGNLTVSCRRCYAVAATMAVAPYVPA